MVLSEYDTQIKPHLHAIEHHAMSCARHARELRVKPTFPTYAQQELQETRQTLLNALACVHSAINEYNAKPTED